MLGALGLDRDERGIYATLLEAGRLSTTELTDRTGISDAEVAIEGLRVRGLVDTVDGADGLFHAVAPVRAISRVVTNAAAALGGASVALAELEESLRLNPAATDVPGVELLNDRFDATDRLSWWTEHARERIWVLEKRPPNDRPAEENPLEVAALERGVEIRVIYETAAIDKRRRLSDIVLSVGSGEQARVLPSVPTKVFTFDGQHALVSVLSDSFEAFNGVLSIQDRTIVGLLDSLFETLWPRAIPLDLVLGPTEDEFTDDERELMGMMASGLTDKSIARQLGVSLRTVQRRVADVIERLDAETRFQAGLQAARRHLF